MTVQDSISPIAAPAGTAGAADPTVSVPAGAPHTAGVVSGTTKISSLEDLRAKAPEVYQKMLEGIAQTMINQIKEHQDKLKKMMEDARRDSGQA